MLHMDPRGELYEGPPKAISLRACNWCPNATPNEPNDRGEAYCDKCLKKMGV